MLPPSLHLALGLWFEKSGGTRAEYVRLREILQLSQPSTGGNDEDDYLNPVQTLPLKLDTLKRQVRWHIPLLRLMRKPLPVTIEKQPSLPQRQKGVQRQIIERMAWQYWYDPFDLVRTILSATTLQEKMFFGMAHYVDEPTELWESQAWGSSIRTTSGDICYTRTGNLIIPGDIVRIKAASPYKIGRVTFVGRDHRANATVPGEVVVTLQVIAERQPILETFELDLDTGYELFLLEDLLVEQSPNAIDRHLPIYLDREYGEDDEEEIVFPDERRYIRRVLNLESSSVRPLRQLHQTRGELEVAYFGRQKLESLAINPHKSLPYFLFIDDFGVHRNMYRALKAFYLIPACLEYSERRKLANVFTLSLGPHGAKIEDVVEAFSRPVQKLDRGVQLDINGEMTTVWAFAITFLGDMPQQADNAGFMRHSARMGCRSCFCPKEERGNLNFDIVGNGRYHWETIQQREYADSLDNADLKIFIRDTGVRLEVPPIAKLAPALDLIQSRPYDAPHSEWRGLGRILQGFLMTSILSKRGVSAYLKTFQNFQFPPGWKRIQSPAFYIWSWSLSEAGKATVLAPLILRSQARVDWFRLPFLQAVASTMIIESSPLRAVVKAFGVIARSNTLVGTQRYTEPNLLHQHVLEARKAYQDLIACGAPIAAGFGGPDSDSDHDRGLLDEVLEEVISNEDHSDSEVIPQTLSERKAKGKSVKGKGKGRKGNSKFEKLSKLPNVHAGLHLAGNAAEYATVMNSNVLAGELKHKYVLQSLNHRG